jgi:transcriptional regulator with XRE-family HTH domain
VDVRAQRRAALGQAIRARRQQQGMTIEGLADAAHMHPTYLSGIERGRFNPTWDKLSALADTLECRLSEIVRDAERRSGG